ncbi:response regulator [Streptomyces canarius]
MTPGIRVLIADDQPLVRRGLSLILSPDPAFEVVGEAEDGAQAVMLAQRLSPDVVVMDIRMPVLDGVGATEELARTLPGCRVLALSTFDMDEYVVAEGPVRGHGVHGKLPPGTEPGRAHPVLVEHRQFEDVRRRPHVLRAQFGVRQRDPLDEDAYSVDVQLCRPAADARPERGSGCHGLPEPVVAQ